MPRGRPRKLPPEEVLTKAMQVFWERGYDGTSMNDLVQETGMAKPGLYANFGDKEELYRKALSHYVKVYGDPTLDYLVSGEDALKKTIRTVLEGVADFVSQPDQPGGCFVVNGVVDCSGKQSSLEKHTRGFDKKRCDAFHQRFQQAKEAGELPDECNAPALADFFAAQLAVLGVMAKAKADRQAMNNLIETALSVLPD